MRHNPRNTPNSTEVLFGFTIRVCSLKAVTQQVWRSVGISVSPMEQQPDGEVNDLYMSQQNKLVCLARAWMTSWVAGTLKGATSKHPGQNECGQACETMIEKVRVCLLLTEEPFPSQSCYRAIASIAVRISRTPSPPLLAPSRLNCHSDTRRTCQEVQRDPFRYLFEVLSHWSRLHLESLKRLSPDQQP